MRRISYPHGRWSVDVTESQYEAGLKASRTDGATHYCVWRAFVDAGVPVRDESGRTIASLAATALQAGFAEGLVK